jgi:membrane protease YdiL (CAAX protease family)
MLDERPPGDIREMGLPEASLSEIHPQPTPWSLRDLGLFAGLSLVALVVSNLLVLAIYAALKPVMGWRVPPQAVEESPFFIVAFQSVFDALLFGLVYLLVVFHRQGPFWTALRWRKPTGRELILFLLGGVVLAFAVQFAPSILPDRESFPLERLFTSTAGAYAIASFAVLVAPFMEELVFRGLLFAIFERLAGLRVAIVGTALLFAALHVPEYWGAWQHVLMILVVGVVFSLARGSTGSLAPSVILHFAYNATLMTGLFFGTQHFRAIQCLLTS